MLKICELHPEQDTPLYQQLIDALLTQIKDGTLCVDTRLPTVRELADSLGIARGTIKRAYDELERQGMIEMVQGRGTFVRYQSVDAVSRKEQAMAAIDNLFDTLSGLNFSLAETEIFLDLKLREREERAPELKVAAVECNSESLSKMVEELRQIGQIDIYPRLLDQVLAYPYELEKDMDLIVTTTEHYAELAKNVHDRDKLAQVALRLSTDYMTQLVKLRTGQTVGILTDSERFAQLMISTCETYADHLHLMPPRHFTPDLDVNAYFADKDAVLVPEDYEHFCPRELHNAMRAWEKKGRLIRCSYLIDDGSIIYLKEKIERLREKRRI